MMADCGKLHLIQLGLQSNFRRSFFLRLHCCLLGETSWLHLWKEQRAEECSYGCAWQFMSVPVHCHMLRMIAWAWKQSRWWSSPKQQNDWQECPLCKACASFVTIWNQHTVSQCKHNVQFFNTNMKSSNQTTKCLICVCASWFWSLWNFSFCILTTKTCPSPHVIDLWWAKVKLSFHFWWDWRLARRFAVWQRQAWTTPCTLSTHSLLHCSGQFKCSSLDSPKTPDISNFLANGMTKMANMRTKKKMMRDLLHKHQTPSKNFAGVADCRWHERTTAQHGCSHGICSPCSNVDTKFQRQHQVTLLLTSQCPLTVVINLGSCDCPAKLIWTKPWQAKGTSKSEVLVVKTARTLFIPKVTAIAEWVIFHARAEKTKVGGTDNSNAHARLDAAKGGRTRVPPFFAEELSDPFEGVDCLGAEHAIDGHNCLLLNGLLCMETDVQRSCC